MRVLTIMAHPDDMELHCGGTLLRCKKRGDEVFVCHMANGNMGSLVIEPDELAKIREQEAKNAGALGGFEVINGGFGDLTINSAVEEQQNRVIEIMRYVNPDFVITHSPADYCTDHAEVSRLVFNASYSATCPHFKPNLGDAARIVPLLYASTDLCINFIPTEYVDVSDELDTVANMMRCHKSQIEWLIDHDGHDPVEDLKTRAAFLGGQCNVKYAEAYANALVSGRLRPYRLLP